MKRWCSVKVLLPLFHYVLYICQVKQCKILDEVDEFKAMPCFEAIVHLYCIEENLILKCHLHTTFYQFMNFIFEYDNQKGSVEVKAISFVEFCNLKENSVLLKTF